MIFGVRVSFGRFSGSPARIFKEIQVLRFESECSEDFRGPRGPRQVFRDSGPDFRGIPAAPPKTAFTYENDGLKHFQGPRGPRRGPR